MTGGTELCDLMVNPMDEGEHNGKDNSTHAATGEGGIRPITIKSINFDTGADDIHIEQHLHSCHVG